MRESCFYMNFVNHRYVKKQKLIMVMYDVQFILLNPWTVCLLTEKFQNIYNFTNFVRPVQPNQQILLELTSHLNTRGEE